MFRFRDSSQLELAFDRAVRDLKNYSITSEEYRITLDVAKKLDEMIDGERSTRLNKNTIAVVSANLLGIIMVIKHEQFNVVTSRAFSLIMNPFTRV